MWPKRDRTRFETLVRAYSADLYRFAYWLTRERALAEDLVQECFARAWKHLDQLQTEAAAKHWLFSIVRNEHARLYAKPRAERDACELEDVHELAAPMLSIPAGLALNQALDHLPPSHREPLLMQVLGGFSCAEIGIMLTLSEANVMARVSRARRALRALLDPADATLEHLS